MGKSPICLVVTILTGILAQNAAAGHVSNQFVRAEGTHLMLGKQRFYYYGANCFYLPHFAQDTNVVVEGQSWRDMADEVLVRCSAWDLRYDEPRAVLAAAGKAGVL